MEGEVCKKPRMDESLIKVILKWNNQMFHLEVDPEDDVAILKFIICRETEVI
jgi:hypothetical protein